MDERKSRYEQFLEDEARKEQPTKRRVQVRKRRYKDRVDRFWKRYHTCTLKVGDCLEWQGFCTEYGYPQCTIDGKRMHVARVVYMLAVGPVSDNESVLLKCNNKKCVRQSHLQLATKEVQEIKRRNSAAVDERHGSKTHPEQVPRGDRNGLRKHPESILRGDKHWSKIYPERCARGSMHGSKTHPECLKRGEAHGMAKLDAEKVREIRARFERGESKLSIAKLFGVGHATVRHILSGRTWKHVQ